MATSNQNYMAKSKTKAEYINELVQLTQIKAKKLTIKQLKTLIAKYA